MKITILAVAAVAVLGSAQPSPLRTPYRTERAWAVQQITADIQEMAGKSGPVSWNVGALTPWNPDAKMVAFAAAQFGSVNAIADDAPLDQYPALVQASPGYLFAASQDVSSALKQHMRNARAHEAAAIILGAFGLLEAADDFTDLRWVMNRMTAHLAVAAALRGPSGEPSIDGRLASALLAALANRQSTALDIVARLGDMTVDSPKAAWQRALTMRVTQDWQWLKTPATATRLEKLEYFRARRMTLPERRAGRELEDLREPDAADFARIVQSTISSVEDGYQFIADGVVRELQDLAVTYQREFNRPMSNPLPEVINDRAGRLMASGQPRILPWGAWAEFAQRHMAMTVADTDRFYRRTLGLPEKADSLNKTIDGVLRALRMFSVGSIGRRIGADATERDLTYFRDALDVLGAAPELVTVNYWKSFETAARRERLSDRVPSAGSWFIEPSGEVPYDAAHRLPDPDAVPLAVHQALVDVAPYDVQVLWTANARQPQDAELYARANRLIRARVGYDLWAIDREADRSTRREDWEPHLRRGCELSPDRCIALAKRLAPIDEQAAAVEYERALGHPALDRVIAANNSEWLVFYYERNNEPERARALAETAADAYSHTALRTLARLRERRGDLEAASEVFEAIVKRYPQASETLAGFLYRRAVVHRDTRFAKRWEEVRQATFPNGLLPEPTAPVKPVVGVNISRDSAAARRAQLRTGDIIVGVDGWRVDNKDQFEAVLAFGDQLNTHRITAWRDALFTASMPADHGMTLDSYPLKGGVR